MSSKQSPNECHKTKEEDTSQNNENIGSMTEQKILFQLECPICFHLMVAPILQCASGHNICKDCSVNTKECPSCKSDISGTRNYALEAISETFIGICGYEGCLEIIPLHSMKSHKANCSFRDINCPFTHMDNCSWKGQHSFIINHLKECHNDHIYGNEIIGDVTNLTKDSISVIKFNKMFFILCIEYNNSNCFHFCVSMLGKSDASKYKFKICIPSDESELVITNTCRPPTQCDQIFITIPDILDKNDKFKLSILENRNPRKKNM